MLRRMLALFLAALLALTLCACGAGPAGEAEEAVPAYYTAQYFPLPAETLPGLACIQNGRVYYTAEGEGDPFALLYSCGPAGEDAAVLEPFRAFQQEGWKDGYRVYEPWQLMPGRRGRSSSSPGEAPPRRTPIPSLPGSFSWTGRGTCCKRGSSLARRTRPGPKRSLPGTTGGTFIFWTTGASWPPVPRGRTGAFFRKMPAFCSGGRMAAPWRSSPRPMATGGSGPSTPGRWK